MIDGNLFSELTTAGRENLHYNWSGIIKDESLIDIEKIYLRSFGSVDIPVSSEVIETIEAKYYKPMNSQNEAVSSCCQVEGCEVFIIPGNKKKLSEMLGNLTENILARMLDIEIVHLILNIKTSLDQLLICKPGQTFSKNLNNKREPGTFGTLLMQIPINHNDFGGQLVIKDEALETTVSLRNANQEGFFVAAMVGTYDGNESFAIHSGGMVMMLVFNIIWKDCINLHWTWGLFPKYLAIAEKISKALQPWKETQLQKESNLQSDSDASFLCLALSSSYGPDPSSWNITGQDLVISKIFAMLCFVDVNYAIIKPKYRQTLNNQEAPLFVFEKGHFTPNAIRDGLFNATINLKKQLISNKTFIGQRLAVLVIRPRASNFRLSRSLMENLRPEVVLVELEERMFVSSLADKSESSSISRDLELVLDLLQQLESDFLLVHGTKLYDVYQESGINCIKCLLYRLLIVCNHFKNASQGLRVLLHISNLEDHSIFFRCHKCGVDLTNPNPVVVIAQFINQVAGWGMSYTPLKMMLNSKLSENTYADFCDLGIKLIEGSCETGAREIYHHVCCYLKSDAVKKFQTDEFCYSVQFFDLAIELHMKFDDDAAIQKALKLSRLASPSSLTLLIDHLSDRMKNGFDTTYYLRELGEVIAGKITPSFSFNNLLKILKTYHALRENKILELLWTNICSQCIQVHNSEDCETANLKVSCLFCHLLLSTVDSDDLLKTLANARNALDALGCSIDKITGLNSGSSFHYKEVYSYVRRIIELQNLLPVYFHPERMESFSSLFTGIHVDDICIIIDALLERTRNSAINAQSPLVKQLLEKLLKRKDLNAICRDHIPKLMESCFFSGDSNVMKTLIGKVNSLSASQAEFPQSHVLMISNILKKNEAMSSNCGLFRLLICEWVATLRRLKCKRPDSFLDCFQVLFNAEQNLPDFANAKVILEFCKTLDSLDIDERIEILKGIFTCEYGEDINSSLKSLPASFKIFSSLCNSITSSIDADKLAQVSVESVVVLIQSFYWLGGERPIIDFSRLLLCIPRSAFVDEVLEAIIFEENTADLAAGSPFGVVSLGDLIDRRIQHLTPVHSSKGFFSRICPSRISRSKSNSVFYVQPDKTDEVGTGGVETLRKKMEQLTQYKAKFLKGLSDK